MDWRLVVTTFAAIFVAEMGDKTQLAAFTLAGGGSSRWAVFLGASLALVATTAVAVLAGGLVGRYVPLPWLRRGAGVIFLFMGLAFLFGQPEAGGAAEPAEAADAPPQEPA